LMFSRDLHKEGAGYEVSVHIVGGCAGPHRRIEKRKNKRWRRACLAAVITFLLCTQAWNAHNRRLTTEAQHKLAMETGRPRHG
jgi:hypothetical protein